MSSTFRRTVAVVGQPNYIPNTTKGVFNMLHGSYLSDWDKSDNIARGCLAVASHSLVWAQGVGWVLHPMGLGEPIGSSLRLSQNDSTLYEFGALARYAYLASR